MNSATLIKPTGSSAEPAKVAPIGNIFLRTCAELGVCQHRKPACSSCDKLNGPTLQAQPVSHPKLGQCAELEYLLARGAAGANDDDGEPIDVPIWAAALVLGICLAFVLGALGYLGHKVGWW